MFGFSVYLISKADWELDESEFGRIDNIHPLQNGVKLDNLASMHMVDLTEYIHFQRAKLAD